MRKSTSAKQAEGQKKAARQPHLEAMRFCLARMAFVEPSHRTSGRSRSNLRRMFEETEIRWVALQELL